MLFYFGQIFEQSMLSFPLVLGIYLSFSIIKIADLTVDGSFVLGACVYAVSLKSGCSPVLALMLATLAGMAAGGLCALVQQHNQIDPLICGILMAFILHSLSLVIMQRPNIGLLGGASLFSMMASYVDLSPEALRLLTLMVVVGLCSVTLVCLLASSHGLWLKAFGNSQELVSMLGRNPEHLRITGLAVGNGLAALSGCLTAQASGYADINMGFGQALIGIAMILLGRELMRLLRKTEALHDWIKVLCTFFGVGFYFLLTNELIRRGLSAVYLKMAVGVVLIGFLLLSAQRAVNKGSRVT